MKFFSSADEIQMNCGAFSDELRRRWSVEGVEQDEGCPIERIGKGMDIGLRGVGRIVAHDLLCLMEGLLGGVSFGEFLVEGFHEHGGGTVVHFPQAHEQGLAACFLETALEAEDAVAGDCAEARLAGAEDDEADRAQVES